MPGWIVRVTLLAGMALLAVPVSAQEDGSETPPEFTISTERGWSGGIFGDTESGQFTHCGAGRNYDNGIHLTMMVHAEWGFAFVLMSDGFEFDPEDQSTARVRIDEEYDEQVPAIPLAEQLILVDMVEEPTLYNLVRQGARMTIDLPSGNWEFPLSGTNEAFGLVGECYSRAVELVREAADEAEAAEAEEVSPEEQAEQAIANIRDLLARFDIEPEQVALANEDAYRAYSLSILWQAEGIIGGIHQQPRAETVQIDLFVEQYIDHVATSCIGDFNSTRQEPEVFNDFYGLQQASVECLGEHELHMEVVAILDDNKYTVILHQAGPEQRQIAVDLSEQIAQSIRDLAVDVNRPDPVLRITPPTPEAAPEPDEPAPETPAGG